MSSSKSLNPMSSTDTSRCRRHQFMSAYRLTCCACFLYNVIVQNIFLISIVTVLAFQSHSYHKYIEKMCFFNHFKWILEIKLLSLCRLSCGWHGGSQTTGG